MVSTAWKKIETMVAVILRGIRSWDTDHDVLLVVDGEPVALAALADREARGKPASGSELLGLSQMGLVVLASVEVKNLTAPSVAQLEAFLIKNRMKADRDGVRHSALVIKRKPGRGRTSPYLLVLPLEVPQSGD